MKTPKKIKNLLNKSKVTISSDKNDKILSAALLVYKRTQKERSARSERNIWIIIMTSRITKLAAAAVIIIAILFGINHFVGSIDVTSVTWGEVRSAYLQQVWVHLKYDNGEESWYNLKTGDHCHKQLYLGGSFVYINRTDNLRQRYTPEHGQHIREDRPAIYPDDIVPEYEPETAWERIVGHWEKITKQDHPAYYEVEIRSDTLEGNAVVRFDIYYIDALEQRLLTKQLWANPLTKLPIKIRKKLTAQQQKNQSREYTTGTFSFPETGPKSIYDLGVPENLPIAKDYDKTADPSIEEIIETAKQYYENFPKRCRAVIWQDDDGSEIEVIWRDGEKIHFNHYFNMVGEKYSQYHLDVPATLEEVLKWAKTQPPISIYMDDGIKSYDRSYHPAFQDLKTPKTRITRSGQGGMPTIAYFIEANWGYMEQYPKRFKYIEDAPEELKQYVGIRRESGTIRRDHYIDPDHDYIHVRWIWWELRNGQWEKEREYVNLELAQLPSGHWYESKRKLIQYPNPEKGYDRHESNYTINIELLNEDEFPPDTFNADLLLENAKIETY